MSSKLIQCTFFWGFIAITHFSFFITRNKIGDLHGKTEVVVESEQLSAVDQEKLIVLDK